jgi:hypothetical protein
MNAPHPRRSRMPHVVASLPDVVLLPALWLCVITTLTIIIGVFNPWTVVPGTVVLSALTWRWRPSRYTARFGWQGTTAAIVFIVVWAFCNLPYASEYLVVDRDPGFLTLEGVWLRHHGSGNIPLGAAAHVADTVSGASAGSLAYFAGGDTLYAQGAKLVSGLLAIGGWVGGTTLLLAANIVIGAAALFMFYGFARRVVGPLWALAGLFALGVSMPFVAFTRSAYTEPLVLGLTFGGLTFMWVAFSSRRWQHFVAAGALLGAGGLARIDGASIILGFGAGLAVVAWAGIDRRRRIRLRTAFFLAVSVALLVLLLGLIDLLVDSPAYFSDLRGQAIQLFGAMFATILLGALFTLERPWAKLRAVFDRNRRLVANVLAGVTVVVAAVLASRPLWLVTHREPIPLIAGMQGAEGLPIDPTRSYDEMSVSWIAWYFSWILVIVGFLGLAAAIRHAVRARDPRLMVFVTTVAAASLLYLVRVSIVPDQIWAMRRLLPVTIPGLLVLALWLLRSVWVWSKRRRARVRWPATAVVALLAFALTAFPLTTWGNMWAAVQQGGRLNEVNVLCSRLTSDHVVFVSPGNLLPTLRTYCDVEVVQFDEKPTSSQLAAVVDAWGGGSVTLVTSAPEDLPWSGGVPTGPTISAPISMWPNTLSKIPHDPNESPSELWIGTIGSDGTIALADPVE